MITLELNLSAIGSHGPDRVLLGATQTGGPLIWDRTYKPHCMLSGETRSGKGGTMRAMQCHDIVTHADVVVIAPDPGEFGWLRDVADVANEDDAPAALTAILEEMDRRRGVLASTIDPTTGTRGLDHYGRLDDPWPRLAVYLDETPAIIGNEATLTYGSKTVEQMTRQIAGIVKRGAKVRVSLVLATQYPTLDGTFGRNPGRDGIRANLPARIHCDRIAESLHAVFDAGQRIPPSTMAHISMGIPGRVGYVFLDPDDGGRPQAGQIMWIEPAQAHQIASAHGGR